MINCKRCELCYTSCIKANADGVLFCDDFVPRIDWEKRRYEIAKDAMIGILASPIVDGIDQNPSIYEVTRHSVLLADTLINELKKK